VKLETVGVEAGFQKKTTYIHLHSPISTYIGRYSREFPMGRVGSGDGLAVKVRREEGLDLGPGVKPGGDLFAFAAILQAAVDLFADWLGQPRDFAIASHIVMLLFALRRFLE
jgi:hypothetical protein